MDARAKWYYAHIRRWRQLLDGLGAIGRLQTLVNNVWRPFCGDPPACIPSPCAFWPAVAHHRHPAASWGESSCAGPTKRRALRS